MPRLQYGMPAVVTGNNASFQLDHVAGEPSRWIIDGSDVASLTAIVIGPDGEVYGSGLQGSIAADAPAGVYTIAVSGGEGYEPGGRIDAVAYRGGPRPTTTREPLRRRGRGR